MPVRHLSARLFDKLLRGDVRAVTPDEARELAWHLMEACPDCADAANLDWVLDDPENEMFERASIHAHREAPPLQTRGQSDSGDDDLEEVFDRVQKQVRQTIKSVEESSKLAVGLADELLRQPSPRQRLLVHNDSRFQTLPVAERLLERAWAMGMETPGDAESLAELVLDILDRVDALGISEAIRADLRARTWGLVANFRRIAADFRGADEAFSNAWAHLAEGSGDLLERARLLTLESTLRRYQAQQDRAAGMLRETITIYRALGEEHLVGRTMVNQANLLNEQGDPARAIEILREAQAYLDPGREPHVARVVQQNLVAYLSESGRYEEAMALVPSLRMRITSEGTRVELLRLRWLEGQIHLGLGNETRTEAALLEVRRGMLELAFPKDVALVSLELAALYMRQGRTGEIRELAAQMYPIFQSRDLHQEAIAALLLFQRAVEMDTLTLRMVEEVADVVRRSQEKPRPKAPEPS